MKKTVKGILILLIPLFLFKGILYKTTVKYQDIGTRNTIQITHPKLIEIISHHVKNDELDIKNIIQIANQITIEQLSFSTKKVSSNPNQLIEKPKANCIGYSAMFNSIAHYIIQENNLTKDIQVKHKIGQLYFLGIDVHQFLQHPFFKDHDFNEIQNLNTGETIYIDPSIYDYLKIKTVSLR